MEVILCRCEVADSVLNPPWNDEDRIPWRSGCDFEFKHGIGWSDKHTTLRQIEEFLGTCYPEAYISAMGEYISGGFDGIYQVYKDDEKQFLLTHAFVLRAMRSPMDPTVEFHQVDLLRVCGKSGGLFRDDQGRLTKIPWGKGYSFDTHGASNTGYFAFELDSNYSVCYVSGNDPVSTRIAPDFEAMLTHTYFIPYDGM